MLAERLLTWTAGSLLIAGCGGGTAQVRASASADAQDTNNTASAAESAPDAAGGSAARHAPEKESKRASEPAPSADEPPRGPSYDPKLVRQALDLSAQDPPDGRARLGLRLAVVEQGPDRPWLVALVNRGTEPTSVVFDLRTLVLEVTPKPAEPDPNAKSWRGPPKPAKPTICALPKDVVPKSEQRNLETQLLPGEALIDAFDPRLYCMPQKGATPLAPGATVVVRLGFSEKTKNVWRKGKLERVVVEQAPPFLARLRQAAPSMPKPGSGAPPEPSAPSAVDSGAPASDRFAVKLLTAPGFSLGDEYADAGPEPDRREPLALVASGSDASTEREATVTVSLSNRSDDAYDVHFRREFVSFEVSGPAGFVECNAGPDDRSPDKALFSRLRPGRTLAARSRLIELCPAGALRTPGLYLVYARFDAAPGGASASEIKPFWGRVVSRKPATVRVRKGWGELAAQHAPLRVRVGSAAPE